MVTRNIIFAIAAFLSQLPGAIAGGEGERKQNPELDQTVKLEVNAEGLNLIADYIRSTSLRDIDNLILPDIEDTVDNGVEVKASGLHLWAYFGTTTLSAEQEFLQAKQQIIKIKVHADSIRMRKKVLGAWVSTTCDDTDITAGNAETVHLNLQMKAQVNDRTIVLSEKQTDFAIPEDQYDVDGPRRCSGALGVGGLIRLVAKSVLKNSRGKIEDAVERRIKDLIPTVADSVNRTINRRFDIDLNQAPLPQTKVTAITFPHAVNITPGSFTATVGTDLVRAVEPTAPLDLEGDFVEKSFQQIDIGAAGINPTIIKEAFKAVFPTGTPWIELGADSAPGLSDALNVSSAAGIWPDLNEIPLTERHLRLSMRLTSAPDIAVHPQGNYIGVDIAGMELMFMAQINGQWRNYFKMRLGIESGLSVNRVGQNLAVSFSGPKTLQIDGQWADGYQPVIPIFEQDVAELIFKSIIDFLYGSGPLTVIAVPEFAVGDRTMSAGTVSLYSPFIQVRLLQQ